MYNPAAETSNAPGASAKKKAKKLPGELTRGLHFVPGQEKPIMMQSPSDNWLHWLYTNAPAAWISAFVAVGTLLYVLRNKTKPRRLVIREVSTSSLVRIWPGVRGKIKMSFDGNPISTLGQIDLDVFNSGSKAIQQPDFTLTLPAGTRILDSHATPQEARAELQIQENKVAIHLPYLNSFHEHRQIIMLSILVDGKTSPVHVAGAGEDWSVLHLRLPTVRQESLRELSRHAIPLVVAIATFPYIEWTAAKFGIGDWEISWRATRLFMPAILALAGIICWEIWMLNRKSRRQRRGWAMRD
jgi:hypothetical protein